RYFDFYPCFYFLGLLNDLWAYIPVCFGLPPNNPQVCSGRGKCIDDDVCECTGSIGYECEIPLCFEIPANVSSVCSAHGSCKLPDHCECDENWLGEKCDIPKCFGLPANDTQ